MQFTDITINQMREKIYEQAYHPYLSEQLNLPNIDEDKLFLLMSILHSKNLTANEYEKYVITVMLIQIALDTHDLVRNEEEFMPHKQRQLTVLAGDYYSGLYYKNLAHLPNIQLVRQLAEGIKIINENKITVYKKEILTIDDYFKSMQLIETSIYQKLASFFQDSLWENISANWLHLNHLMKSKNQLENYIVVNNLKTANNITLNGHNRQMVISMINEYIETVQKQLKFLLKDKPDLYQILADQQKGLKAEQAFSAF